jgi:uncharacterized damage-inducible protein DinB
MLAVADRLGDERVNERPIAPHVNSVASLVIHCCGVAEFWLGHVGVGRPSERDRDGEFTATASVPELHARAQACLVQMEADLAAIDAGLDPPHAEGLQRLQVAPGDPASLVVHVIEELFQHLGHCEIAADALTA